MTLQERKQFINEYCDYIRNRTLSAAACMPQGWKGLEIKWYLEDQFTVSARLNDAKRHTAYANELEINGGL